MMKQRIAEWSEVQRKMAGLVGGAVLGCYLPYVPLSLIGVWTHNWLNWNNNVPFMAMLLVAAFFVEKAKKPALVYSAIVVVATAAMAILMLMTIPPANWIHYWVLPYFLGSSAFVSHKVYRYFTV